VSKSTVGRVLTRAGLSHLKDLEPIVPVMRYEHEAAGDLLHIDIKRHRRILRPGHRVTGDRRGIFGSLDAAPKGRIMSDQVVAITYQSPRFPFDDADHMRAVDRRHWPHASTSAMREKLLSPAFTSTRMAVVLIGLKVNLRQIKLLPVTLPPGTSTQVPPFRYCT